MFLCHSPMLFGDGGVQLYDQQKGVRTWRTQGCADLDLSSSQHRGVFQSVVLPPARRFHQGDRPPRHLPLCLDTLESLPRLARVVCAKDGAPHRALSRPCVPQKHNPVARATLLDTCWSTKQSVSAYFHLFGNKSLETIQNFGISNQSFEIWSTIKRYQVNTMKYKRHKVIILR